MGVGDNPPIVATASPETRGRPRRYLKDRPASRAELGAISREKKRKERREALELAGVSFPSPRGSLRLLCLSDIHNLVQSVQELRSREANGFDAVVVAGDLGHQRAGEIMELLRTFDAPVLYVLGNWDFQVDDPTDFGQGTHHLHLNPTRIGDWTFIGESYPRGNGRNRGGITNSREVLASSVLGAGPSACIVVSHDRLRRTHVDMPGLALCLFGHHHGFCDRVYVGTRFVNVSALGVMTTLRPIGASGTKTLRNRIFGSYVIIEIEDETISARSKTLSNEIPDGWERVPSHVYFDAPLLP